MYTKQPIFCVIEISWTAREICWIFWGNTVDLMWWLCDAKYNEYEYKNDGVTIVGRFCVHIPYQWWERSSILGLHLFDERCWFFVQWTCTDLFCVCLNFFSLSPLWNIFSSDQLWFSSTWMRTRTFVQWLHWLFLYTDEATIMGHRSVYNNRHCIVHVGIVAKKKLPFQSAKKWNCFDHVDSYRFYKKSHFLYRITCIKVVGGGGWLVGWLDGWWLKKDWLQ